MKLEQEQNRAFLAVASPTATAVLVCLLLIVSAVGMVIPQGISIEAIGQSYPNSASQVIDAMSLNDIYNSWLIQLVLILLFINLSGLGLRRLSALKATTSANRWLEHNKAIDIKLAPGTRPDDLLKRVLPKSQVRLLAPDKAKSFNLTLPIGLMVIALAMISLVAAWAISHYQGTTGRVWVMVGPSTEASVQSRFRAAKLTSTGWSPWRPDFELSCSETPTGAIFGSRICSIRTPDMTSENQTKKVRLKPGYFIPIGDYRLTLVGAGYLSGVGNFSLDASLGSERSRHRASSAKILDLERNEKLMLSLLIAGNDSSDPVAVLPSSASQKDLETLKIEARPRVELEFRLTTSSHEWALWVAGIFLIIGMFLALIMPSYKVTLQLMNDKCHVRVRGSGLLSRPKDLAHRVLERISTDKEVVQ